MTRHSPYNYAFDNPVFFIDPDGMEGMSFNLAANVQTGSIDRIGGFNVSSTDSEGNVLDTKWVGSLDNVNVGEDGNISVGDRNDNTEAGTGLKEGCDKCDLPSVNDYKNKETYHDEKSGHDFILFDNQWHQLPEEKYIDVPFWDPNLPNGEGTRCVSREQNFINNYIFNTAYKGNFWGAVGGGTIVDFISKKLNIFGMAVGSAVGGIQNANTLYERMEIHDRGVEHNRKKNNQN